MGVFKNLFVLGTVVGIAYVLYPEPKLPEIEEKWFGSTKVNAGQPLPKDPDTIHKFTINISDQVLKDLQRRLESARFVEPISGSQFNYGFNSDYLRKVVDYWRTKYDWRKQELNLNKFNQYKTQIKGINIHFIHVKPTKPAKTVVPLMMIHGWPSSFWLFSKVIPLLIEPKNDIAFEVICPSIPGFGFSDAPQQEGFDILQTAQTFSKLMARLGHKRFFVHGTDWGSSISKAITVLYPQKGMHITISPYTPRGLNAIKAFIGMVFPSLIFSNPEKDYPKIFPIWEKISNFARLASHVHLHATNPDTLGAALIDSPVGMAAYILDKYSMWTDPDNLNKSDGGLTQKYTLDELLTNVMIYWTSNNVASSLRFYKESILRMFQAQLIQIKVPDVPAAFADFPNELLRRPKEFLQYEYGNLVQYTEMPKGGHFAPFEEPNLLAEDIKSFVKIVLDDENKPKSS